MKSAEEQRILYHTILHCLEVGDVGLLTGKMGIALALATYAKANKLQPAEDMAEVLIERCISNLSERTPIGFARGLAGIGWGVEYLAQNGFMSIDTSHVCHEIDKRIMNVDINTLDLSIEKGLIGLLHYINAHIYGNKNNMPFEMGFINNVIQAIDTTDHIVQSNQAEQIRIFKCLINHEPCKYKLILSDFVKDSKIDLNNTHNLSLQNGYAGYLVLRCQELAKTNRIVKKC